MSAYGVAVTLNLLEKHGPFQREMADETLKRFTGGIYNVDTPSDIGIS